jgi:hypothetical protein
MNELKLKSYPDGQTSAILVAVIDCPVMDINPLLAKKIIGKIPAGNRSCIITTWLGNNQICFQAVRSFSTPAIRKLKKQIGENFNIVMENKSSNGDPMNNQPTIFDSDINGDDSSVVQSTDSDFGGREFDSHSSPILKKRMIYGKEAS